MSIADIINLILLITSISTMGLLICQLWLYRKEIKYSIEQAKKSNFLTEKANEIAKIEASFAAVNKYWELINNTSEELLRKYELLNIGSANVVIPFNTKTYFTSLSEPVKIKYDKELYLIVSFFESIATGIINGYYIEDILMPHLKSVVPHFDNCLREYIFMKREMSGYPTKYIFGEQFCRLASTWRDNAKKGGGL